jgi:Fe-S-cluster containining protein
MITLHDVPDDAMTFFRTWGIMVDDNGNEKLLKIYSPCQHLTESGCGIYDNRPQYCHDFRCAEIE